MRRTHIAHYAIVSVLAAVLVISARTAQAEEGHSVSEVPPGAGGETLSMAKFYTGSMAQTGTFPGKLVCLQCDLAHAPGAAEQCKQAGHRHALSMNHGAMIHPLLAGTEAVLEQINSAALHGKKVTVDGKYYPGTGAIFVNRITVAE